MPQRDKKSDFKIRSCLQKVPYTSIRDPTDLSCRTDASKHDQARASTPWSPGLVVIHSTYCIDFGQIMELKRYGRGAEGRVMMRCERGTLEQTSFELTSW